MNAASGSDGPAELPEISVARERLREEIDRVRAGVEEMLAEQGGESDAEMRRELERLREEGRRYAKRRVGKSERRLSRSIEQVDQHVEDVDGRVGDVDQRVTELQQRLESFEKERQYAEWRIHTSTEALLDGLLREVRSIADLLTRAR